MLSNIIVRSAIRITTSESTIKVETTGDSFIDFNSSFTLRLFNDTDEYFFNNLTVGDNAISVKEGTYSTEILDAENVEVTAPSAFSTGKPYIIKVTSKYFLNVNKTVANKSVPFSFSVINIDSISEKVFLGNGETAYGVAPNTSLMLQDRDTEQTFTIEITEGNFYTDLDLSVGAIASKVVDGESPKTADYIDVVFYLAFAIFALLVVFGLLWVYGFRLKLELSNKDKQSRAKNATATKMLALFLSVMIGASSLANVEVFAGSTHGTPSNVTGSSETPAGSLQMWNDTDYPSDLVKLSLVINSDNLYIGEDATIEQLESDAKFWNDESALYIATNNRDYERAMNGGIFAWAAYTDYSGPVTKYGGNFWDGNSRQDSEYYQRLIPTNQSTLEGDGRWGNEFIRFVHDFFKGRKLWDNYGDDLNAYCVEAFTEKERENAIISAYIAYLDQFTNITDEEVASLAKAYSEGKLVLLVETVVGGYLKDKVGYESTTGYYCTVNDAMKLLHWSNSGGKFDYPSREAAAFGPSYISNPKYISSFVGCSGKGSCSKNNCKTMAHFQYSAVMGLMGTYIQTLKPKSSTIDNNSNPFGGWGFFPLGDGDIEQWERKPGIYGEIKYTILDDIETGVDITFTEEVEQYGFDDRRWNPITDIVNLADPMLIPATVEYNGKHYVADTGFRVIAKVFAMDADNNQLFQVGDPDGRNSQYIVGFPYEDLEFDLTDGTTDILTVLNDLALLLGNDEEVGMYAGVDGKVGNVKVVFEVMIWEPLDYVPEDKVIDTASTVPQWRINKYWSDIMSLYDADTKPLWAQYSLTLSPDSGHKTSSLSSQNGARFVLNSPVYDTLPFISKAITDANINSIRLRHSNPRASISIWGDLMAFKDSTVDNLYLANWVKSTPLTYDRFSVQPSAGEPVTQTDSKVTKPISMAYSFNPLNAIIHKVGVYSHGGYYNNSCYCYTYDETPAHSITEAKYNANIHFRCYNAVSVPSGTFEETSESRDGYTEFTQQSAETLNLYAEVPMLYTDTSGNNSVYFAIADKATALKPISFHSLAYTADIDPHVSGMGATDSRAMRKSAEIGNVQILPKGSGTNTAYDVKGKLIAKTFAIDINQGYYKGRWNLGGYSSTQINDNFLAGFSVKQADGSYKAQLNGFENLKINNEPFGNINDSKDIVASGTNVTEHKLTVRAGEITAVNGNRNWRTVYPQLVDVVDKMKLDHSGVFGVFASGTGDILDEAAFETLSKGVREGSNSIGVGKGWYMEDSTILSIYEYTTEFELTGFMMTNKIPSSIIGIETPANKADFYSRAFEGAVTLDIELVATDPRSVVKLHYDSSVDSAWGSMKKLYGVPNVGVLDTTF